MDDGDEIDLIKYTEEESGPMYFCSIRDADRHPGLLPIDVLDVLVDLPSRPSTATSLQSVVSNNTSPVKETLLLFPESTSLIPDLASSAGFDDTAS